MKEETYLDSILAFHRERAQRDQRSLDQLLDNLPKLPSHNVTFTEQIKKEKGLSVIAEIKKRSPSKGVLKPGLNAEHLAKVYEKAGATCISVLTDTEHFGGSAIDLMSVHKVVSIPILRKDFTVDLRDIYDAKVMGASCILLIVAALEKGLLKESIELCNYLGLDALVETHDEGEVEIAIESGADLIGINQRDLQTFEVDQSRALRVVGEIPKHITKVAESGIRKLSDAKPLRPAGFDAVLIGESLVKSESPEILIKQLRKL